MSLLGLTPTAFADAFKELFEMIALAVDHHFPLVETHYGPGTMLEVIVRLNEECERQARKLLDALEEERQPQRMVRSCCNALMV